MITVCYSIAVVLFALEVPRVQMLKSDPVPQVSKVKHLLMQSASTHVCESLVVWTTLDVPQLTESGIVVNWKLFGTLGHKVEDQALLADPDDCCRRTQKMNETCVNSTNCGCVQALENSTVQCVQCDTLTLDLENLTLCNTTVDRTSMFTTIKIGGPGVAASVLLGTLLISLFLILSVASFFYLKRSNRLPGVFYRRKAFIFQPSETAVMIPAASSSVRKPRYVRRERPSAATAVSSSATMPVGHVTKVYNVNAQ